jgi:extradiol dioxygenase family protein
LSVTSSSSFANQKLLFHIAIPSADLDLSREFYVDRLGCRLARRYEDRITLDFFGSQLVCHLDPDRIDRDVRMYPRHFGITIADGASFDQLVERAHAGGATFWRMPFVRFAGMQEEHRTFFLIDPSNNLLEFKHYNDPKMMF